MLLALELVVGRRTIWLRSAGSAYRSPASRASGSDDAPEAHPPPRALLAPRFRPLLDQHLSGVVSASSCWG